MSDQRSLEGWGCTYNKLCMKVLVQCRPDRWSRQDTTTEELNSNYCAVLEYMEGYVAACHATDRLI